MPNFAAAYAVQNIPPAIPAVEETVSNKPARCMRIAGSTARVTFIGPNKQRLDLIADLFGTEFLEEARVEVASVVDQDVDAAELPDSGLDRGLGVLGTGDVELHGQQVVVFADRRRDLPGVAAGGDDGVAGLQCGLGDIDAQATACAGNEPNLLVSHGMFLVRCGSRTSALVNHLHLFFIHAATVHS